MTWSEEVHQYRTKEHDKNKKLAESEINTDKSSFRDYIAFTLVATVVMGLIYMLRSKNSAPRKKPRDPREAAANAAERRREVSFSSQLKFKYVKFK